MSASRWRKAMCRQHSPTMKAKACSRSRSSANAALPASMSSHCSTRRVSGCGADPGHCIGAILMLARPRGYLGARLLETTRHRLTAWSDWLADGEVIGLPTALFVVGTYCLTQIVVLPLASHLAGTGVGNDDAEQLVYTQFLWLGYGNSQPPLFTWIAWAVAKLFGPTIFTLKLTKYT